MLFGENGILKKAGNAKDLTGIAQEKEIIVLVYNAALTEKVSKGDSTPVTSEDMNTELTKQGAIAKENNPIIVFFNDSKRQYTIDNGTIEYAGILGQTPDFQWKIVSDNDNNGIISFGDEVEPLINSIKNEHFYVTYNDGDSVGLITKLPVDYVTNSQSATAPGVTFDMAYCNKEGETENFLMQASDVKEYGLISDDEGNLVMGEIYYYQNEIGEVHCTGLYTKSYRDRLVASGLSLTEFCNGMEGGDSNISILSENYKGYIFDESNDFIIVPR